MLSEKKKRKFRVQPEEGQKGRVSRPHGGVETAPLPLPEILNFRMIVGWVQDTFTDACTSSEKMDQQQPN